MLKEMFNELKQVVIFSGGFHPPMPHHIEVFKYLSNKFPKADLFIACSNDKSTRPFSFEQKQWLAEQAGIPKEKIVLTKSPYKATEITQNYDPYSTVLIFGVSEKDGDRFSASGFKKDGTPSYFQPYNSDNLQTFDKHAYFFITPIYKDEVIGTEITSASELRKMYSNASDNQRKAIIHDLYPSSIYPLVIKQIFDDVIGTLSEARVKNYNLMPCYNCKDIGYIRHETLKTRSDGTTYKNSSVEICKKCGGSGKIRVPLIDFKKIAANDLNESPDFGYSKFNDRDDEIKNDVRFLEYDNSDEFGFEVYKGIDWAGHILCYMDRNIAKIKEIYTDASWKRTGLGQILYDKAIAMSKSKGAKFFQSDVDRTPAAEAAWKKISKRYSVYKVMNNNHEQVYCIDLRKVHIRKNMLESPDFGYNTYNNRETELNKVRYDDDITNNFLTISAYYENEKIAYLHANVHSKESSIVIDKVEIYGMYHKAWRGTGLGQILYERAIQLAKSEGFDYFRSDQALSKYAHKAWSRIKARYGDAVTLEKIPDELVPGEFLDEFYQIDLRRIPYRRIVEEIEQPENSLENYIKTNCTQILNIYKQLNMILYRGIKTTQDYFKAQSPINRPPRDTDEKNQIMIDDKLESSGFKALRRNSIFTSSFKMGVEYYGEIYVIFPEDGFDFTWSSLIADLYQEYTDINSKFYEDFTDDLINMSNNRFIYTFAFQKSNIVGAIKSGYEILIHGKYVAIKYDYFIQNNIGKNLGLNQERI
jgi:GNAT superfamily N-acetyltransferase